MKLTIYQVDAFTSHLFGGNPATVIPLRQWISDELMQQLAMENNQSETVFYVPSMKEGVDFDIRWFTPVCEINLCGHATLAAAFVHFIQPENASGKIVFHSQSGLLTVTKNEDWIEMDFPSWNPRPVQDHPAVLCSILGVDKIISVHRYRDWLVELESEEAVAACRPDFSLMKAHTDKLIITAAGREVDFVSRFFAPGVGIDEDPVTGSAHSQLIPYWHGKTGKTDMLARQLSARGGYLKCRQVNEERVVMSGQAVLYMTGEINCPAE